MTSGDVTRIHQTQFRIPAGVMAHDDPVRVTTSAVRLITPLVQFDCDGHQSEAKHNGVGAEAPGQDEGLNKGSEDQQRTVDY
jgi:hypothetical protein